MLFKNVLHMCTSLPPSQKRAGSARKRKTRVVCVLKSKLFFYDTTVSQYTVIKYLAS